MKAVLVKIVHSNLACGWIAWREFVDKSREREDLMEVVIRKLTHGKLGAGLRGWHAAVVSMKRQEVLLVKVCGRMEKGQIWKGFRQWTEVSKAMLRHETRWHQEKKAMRKVMSRMLNNSLICGFSGWVDFTNYQVQQERFLKKILQKMRNSFSYKVPPRPYQFHDLL